MTFNTDQRRNLQNLLQFYETWKEVSQRLANLPGGLYWKVIKSKEYLYRYLSEAGLKRTTSLGPRSPETEAKKAGFDQEKQEFEERRRAIEERINTLAPVMKALRLPMIDETAGKVLRGIDQIEEFANKIRVVGTYAITVYEMSAENRFADEFDATEDLDFTLVFDRSAQPDFDFPRRLLLALKEVDKSFMVSTSSSKTVVNKSGYRVDLLMSRSTAPSMQRALPWKPEALEGQEWLSLGVPIQQLLIDHTGWPALATAPDPRYFALHKLWLSRLPKRIRDGKAPKDAAQGRLLLSSIKEHMQHYPLDQSFASSLPVKLKEVWAAE